MKRKRIVVYVTLASFLAASTAYLVSPPQLKLFYVLNYPHLSRVNPQSMIDGSDLVCPLCGSILDRIVIDQIVTDSEDSLMIDESWRIAYYCCNEDVFWVIDFPGGIALAQWYGPFNAYWKLTNALAALILIICGAIIFLLAMMQSKSALMKNQ